MSEIFTSVHDKIMNESPSLPDLVSIAVFMSVFWAVFFAIFCNLVRYFVRDSPKLINVAEREYERSAKKGFEAAGEPMTKAEFTFFWTNLWPWLQVVYVQHLTGALLCVPSIFGIGDPELGASLACLGILSEIGWELQDAASWIITRAFFARGKQRAPNVLFIMLTMHHSLTTILGVPLILNYRNEKTLHWLCFNLQLSAGVGLSAAEYTKLLDVTKPNQLFWFQVISCLSFAVILWTRVIHWVYLIVRFMMIWYEKKAWGFLVVGGILSAVFTLYSWEGVLRPFYIRLRKFLRVKADYQSIPDNDASKELRRSSAMALNQAASEVCASATENEMIAAMMLFPTRRVNRRSTMPPSLWGTSPTNLDAIHNRRVSMPTSDMKKRA